MLKELLSTSSIGFVAWSFVDHCLFRKTGLSTYNDIVNANLPRTGAGMVEVTSLLKKPASITETSFSLLNGRKQLHRTRKPFK